METAILSGGLRLRAHLARPPRAAGAGAEPGLVVCHGFPQGPRETRTSGQSYPDLADRIAAEAGWSVLTFNFRGTGDSEGDFSLGGWLTDLRSAVDHLLSETGVAGVWLAGFSTGGSLAICHAGEDERVRGVAALGSRADFDDWADNPGRFLQHARQIGVVRTAGYPTDAAAWARELRETRPLGLVAKIPPRPLLIVHGGEDDTVPILNARLLADAAGEAELRIVGGAGHGLRHDPRAIAVLLGWLERQAA